MLMAGPVGPTEVIVDSPLLGESKHFVNKNTSPVIYLFILLDFYPAHLDQRSTLVREEELISVISEPNHSYGPELAEPRQTLENGGVALKQFITSVEKNRQLHTFVSVHLLTNSIEDLMLTSPNGLAVACYWANII